MKGVLGCGVKVSISDFESDGDGALPTTQTIQSLKFDKLGMSIINKQARKPQML